MSDEGKIKIIRTTPSKSEALSDAAKKAEQAVLAGGGLSSLDDEDPKVFAGLIDRNSQPPAAKVASPNAKLPANRRPAASPAARPTPGAQDMSFGEVNLGGDQGGQIETADPSTSKATAKGAAKPPAKPPASLASPPQKAAAPEKVQPRSSVRPAPREEPRVKRSYAREIKIALIILVVLAAIGGGIYAFVQYRAKAEQEAAAEKERLDQGSLDNLKDQATKKVSPNS
jgi:hypothetical protein